MAFHIMKMNPNPNGVEMNAQPSPLKCLFYFLSDLVLTANPEYDATKSSNLDFNDIRINSQSVKLDSTDNKKIWRVVLIVNQNAGKEKNSPYNFSATMIGHFEVHKDYPDEISQKLAEINGGSILYGSLRQILWNTMSNGPFQPLFLPTVSFHEDKPKKIPDAKSIPND